MKYSLRLPPNVSGASEKEQITQLRNYLVQLVGDLQFVLDNLDATSSNAAAQSAQATSHDARLRMARTTNKTEET